MKHNGDRLIPFFSSNGIIEVNFIWIASETQKQNTVT